MNKNSKLKECRDCKEIKSLDYFVNNHVFKDGKDTLCNPCNRKRVHADRKKTKRPHNKNRKQSSIIYREIIIDFLVKRDGFNCMLCGQTLENRIIHIDHIDPVALGGAHIMENVRLAHSTCNEEDALDIRTRSCGY